MFLVVEETRRQVRVGGAEEENSQRPATLAAPGRTGQNFLQQGVEHRRQPASQVQCADAILRLARLLAVDVG